MGREPKGSKFAKQYVPDELSKKDADTQRKNIKQTQEEARTRIFKTDKRPSLKSYTPKKSKWVLRAKTLYDVDSIKPSKELAKKAGCSIKALKEITKRGMGAFYSGSRPEQSKYSWGVARLASALSGGGASCVDRDVILKHCSKSSKMLSMMGSATHKGKC